MTGTSAESGAERKTLTHMFSMLVRRPAPVPIRSPSAMPTTMREREAGEIAPTVIATPPREARGRHHLAERAQHLGEGREEHDQAEPPDDLPEHQPDEQRRHLRDPVPKTVIAYST